MHLTQYKADININNAIPIKYYCQVCEFLHMNC
jgi:hypothetical protein